jgi:hypothetical protein
MKNFVCLMLFILGANFLGPETATASFCTQREITKLEKDIRKIERQIATIEARETRETVKYQRERRRHTERIVRFNINTVNDSFHFVICMLSSGFSDPNRIARCAQRAARAAERALRRYNNMISRRDRADVLYSTKMNIFDLDKSQRQEQLTDLEQNLAACQ